MPERPTLRDRRTYLVKKYPGDNSGTNPPLPSPPLHPENLPLYFEHVDKFITINYYCKVVLFVCDYVDAKLENISTET